MSQTSGNGGTRGKSILLVDDNPQARDSRCSVLSTHGYDVHAIDNSAEAHPLWAAIRPDLVLLALSRNTGGTLKLLQGIRLANPQQRVGFLICDSLYLSPLFYNGEMIRKGEGPEDFVERIEALLEDA